MNICHKAITLIVDGGAPFQSAKKGEKVMYCIIDCSEYLADLYFTLFTSSFYQKYFIMIGLYGLGQNVFSETPISVIASARPRALFFSEEVDNAS